MKNHIGKSGIVLIFLSAFLLSACAGVGADELLALSQSKPVSNLGFLGSVDGITDVAWTVDGRTIKLSDDTKLESELRIGDAVRVEVKLGDDGFLSALAIESSSSDLFVIGSEVEFFGVVKEMTPTTWVIGGFEVEVTSATEIKAGIVLGDLVKVHANFSDGGLLVAREIELAVEDEADDDMDRFEIEFYGVVEDIADGQWTVEGFEFVINPWTEIKGLIQVGDMVKVHATFDDADTLIAREIELAVGDSHDHDDDRDEIEFYGVVDAISDASWMIAGREVMVTPQTEIKNFMEVGDLVKVHAFRGDGDMLIAREIELAEVDDNDDDHDRDEVEFVGLVEAISETEWMIDGLLVQVNSETEIEDVIGVGDMAKVEAYEDADGNLIAYEIELADDDDLDSDFDDADDLDDEDDDDDDDDDHDEYDHDEDDHDDDEEDEHDDHDERDGDDD